MVVSVKTATTVSISSISTLKTPVESSKGGKAPLDPRYRGVLRVGKVVGVIRRKPKENPLIPGCGLIRYNK